MSDRDKLVGVSVAAQMTCPNILYCLVTLGRDEHPRWKVEARLAEARQDAEKLLAAIHKAELELIGEARGLVFAGLKTGAI